MAKKSIQYKRRRRLRKLLPGIVVLVFLLLLAVLTVANDFSLVLTLRGEEELTVLPGHTFSDPGVQAVLCGRYLFRDGIKVNASVSSSGVPESASPGTYRVDYTGQFLFWNGKAERTVVIGDASAPTITLISVPGHFTIYGEPYQEEGFSAFDEQEGDLTDRVVRYEENGVVYYSVEDSFGNKTCVTRKIQYIDLTPPEITLVGGDSVTIEAGKPFADPGFTAVDGVDGDLSDQVTVEGTVDIYLAGTYTLRYTVQDASGNESNAVRTVVVVPKDNGETVSPDGKVIYLTFDDGPSCYTEKLLDILKAYDVKVTFFVVDGENRDLLRRMAEDGHSIGIHSVTHDYREIYASPDAYFQDLYAMQKIIYDYTGVETYLMRFPGGSSNTVSRFNPGIMSYLVRAVEDCGFRYFDWNVDSDDAGGARSAREVLKNVTDAVVYRRISIVLQHDNKPFSIDAVEQIIIWGLENGYTFLPLDMSSPTAHHGVNN